MSIQDESVPPDFDLDCSADDNVNQSTSLPINDKYESTKSTIACSSSEISSQTNASEPADVAESTNKRLAYSRNTPSKAFSYQDIHSEYTKKRFKHVESKVAQYIAHMRVQDEKRRNSQQFLRHRSLPETLDHDAGDTNNRPARKNESASEPLKHVDKDTYAQLLSDKERNDYLQSKLDEKITENWRLKRNIDYMRFELTECKDKLQQTTMKLQNAQTPPDSYGRVNALGTQKKQLWQCRSNKFTKATQTDLPLSPSAALRLRLTEEILNTSTTPDSNNNGYDYKGLGVRAPLIVKMPKIVQPISLNFSSAAEREQHNHDLNTTMNVLRQSSHDLSTRKRLELACSINKAPNHFIDSSNTSSHLELTTSSEGLAATQQRQSDQEQLMRHTNCSQFLNYDENGNANAGSIYATNESKLSIVATDGAGKARNTRKRRSLHSRMMRIFRSCIRCDNPNHTLDSTSNEQRQQQSYTQIPLLEKSFKNYCRNECRAAV